MTITSGNKTVTTLDSDLKPDLRKEWVPSAEVEALRKQIEVFISELDALEDEEELLEW
jgi:hypothetical protein